MKKTLIITTAILTFIASVGFTAAVSSFATTDQGSSSENLTVNVLPAGTINAASLASTENVFIITNSDGSPNKSFVNNTINNTNESFPLEASITYSLDGHELPASELIGKSGHIKITYNFTATKSYQDKLIPFLAVTGFILDNTKFNNITIDHGKIINESSDNIILAGYAFVGLNEDLGTDILSSSFTLEADTTNFELQDTYTFATSELFADLDISKLSSIDDLVSSINELSSAFDQIIAGGNNLASGLDQALIGSKSLQSGAHELSVGATRLNSGAHELSDGAAELSDGLNQLVAFNNGVINKIDTTTTDITTTIQELITTYHIDPNSPLIKRVNDSITKYYNTAYTAVTTYTGNIELLSDGANQLSDGANQLAAGTTELAAGSDELATGTDTLVAGLNQLSTGGHTLASGLSTFKAQGINRLVNFANQDLTTFANNLRSTVDAAKSYHHYNNSSAKSVKFIFKTPSLH